MNRAAQWLVRTVCSLALVFSLLPVAAYGAAPATLPASSAVSDAEATAPTSDDPILDTTEEDSSLSLSNHELGPVSVTKLETSAQLEKAIAPFALDDPVVFDQAPGNHVRWIDRLQLPDYAKKLYDVLMEACDNDGRHDYLIDDAYFDGTASSDGAFLRFEDASALLVTTLVNPMSQQLSYAESAVVAAVAAFDRDHPEVFWLGSSVGVIYAGTDSRVQICLVLGIDDPGSSLNMRAVPFENEYLIKHGIWQRDTAVRGILSGLPKNATQVDAVRCFNTWLVQNCQYNTNPDAAGNKEPWKCLSALEGRKGAQGPVCEGYSRAFKVLCDAVGLPCVLVDGTQGGPHMWNYVQISDGWYGVDVTWNGSAPRAESEKWLLRGNAFEESHPVSNLVYDDSTPFTNGPQLASADFSFGLATPQVSVVLPAVGAEPQRPRLSSLTLSKSSFVFNGAVQKPRVTVKAAGRTLGAGSYRVRLSGACKNPGTYRVTVTGCGSFTGSLSATFKIKKPSVAKVKTPTLKAGKKKLAVTWKRVSGKVSGYQVQYGTSKKFAKRATKTSAVKLTTKLAKKKTLSKTVTKLKAKKTYYVCARAYYKVGGKTFYGNWSTVRKVRVR